MYYIKVYYIHILSPTAPAAACCNSSPCKTAEPSKFLQVEYGIEKLTEARAKSYNLIYTVKYELFFTYIDSACFEIDVLKEDR